MSETISKPKASTAQTDTPQTHHFDAAAFVAALDSFDAEGYPGEQAQTLDLLRRLDAEAVAVGERAVPNFAPPSK